MVAAAMLDWIRRLEAAARRVGWDYGGGGGFRVWV